MCNFYFSNSSLFRVCVSLDWFEIQCITFTRLEKIKPINEFVLSSVNDTFLEKLHRVNFAWNYEKRLNLLLLWHNHLLWIFRFQWTRSQFRKLQNNSPLTVLGTLIEKYTVPTHISHIFVLPKNRVGSTRIPGTQGFRTADL